MENQTKTLTMAYRVALSILAIVILELTHAIPFLYWDRSNTWSFIAVVPHVLLAFGFYHFSKPYDNSWDFSRNASAWKIALQRRNLFVFGALSVVLVSCINMAFLSQQSANMQILGSYVSLQKVINTLLSGMLYAFANIFMCIGMLNLTKAYIKAFWVVLLFAILQVAISVLTFTEDNVALYLLHFLAYLTIGYSIVSHQNSFAFGFYFAYELLPTRLICNCTQIVAGIFAFSGVAEMGYTPAFLYSFQIVAMGLVAAYYGRQAYLVSMNRAELVDRGYMMVTDKHGVETPMLRATYQYSVMQAIKPWIAITEAGKKRRRGMVIRQPLQKGWSFYEVFNAQGECLTHGFIDANMDLERMPESYLQDNRPKLAIAWELDTDALYYLRVEFEGETLYGALRMFFNAEERAKQPQTFAYKLSNTWIHPNEEEILTCTLYKASGEEVLVKALYGKYHDN